MKVKRYDNEHKVWHHLGELTDRLAQVIARYSRIKIEQVRKTLSAGKPVRTPYSIYQIDR
jgi:hypothetical protein